MSNRTYILGSHNSWSFLPPTRWWQKPFAFMARCQSADIRQQYFKYGVRCFDLRIRFIDGTAHIVHNDFDYGLFNDRRKDLKLLHDCGDVWIRLVHDVRTKNRYTQASVRAFKEFCDAIERQYPSIKFWFGRNLYDWKVDYDFRYVPSCEEAYSSVKKPILLDDWFPFLYARFRNKSVIRNGTDKDILLMDFVNLTNT